MTSQDPLPQAQPPPSDGRPVSLQVALDEERQHVDQLRAADERAAALNLSGQPIGLALSGGGIRSATVGLGVLQAFAQARWLRRFDYLSTVSGGGYIGGWLSAMLFRQRRFAVAGEDAVSRVETLIAPGDIRKKDEEPPHIAFLRAYSNYLTPRLGVLSADTLAAVAGYLRNLILSLVLAVVSGLLILATFHLGLWLLSAALGNSWARTGVALAAGLAGSLLLTVIAVLLTLQSLDVQPRQNIDARAHILMQALHYVRASYGQLLPWLALPALALAGVWFDGDPRIDIRLEHLGAVLAAALGCMALGALLAYVLLKVAPLLTDLRHPPALDAVFFVAVRGLLHAFSDASGQWLRYVVAGVLSAAAGGALLWWTSTLAPPPTLVGVFRGPALMVGIVCAVFLVWLGVVGTAYSEQTREWISRLIGTLGGVAVAWTLAGVILLNARPALPWLAQQAWINLSTAGVAAGVVVVLWALVAAQRRRRAAAGGPRPRRQDSGRLLELASTVLVIGFLGALTLGFQEWVVRWIDPAQDALPPQPQYLELVHWHVQGLARALQGQPWPALDGPNLVLQPSLWPALLWQMAKAVPALTLWLLALGSAWLAYRFIDVNAFSLQNLYRNRLVRCYLGAANSEERLQDPYQGFDPGDDLPMSALAGQRPLHLINAAINITQGQDLAWQQRKAASFAFSPLWSGYWLESTDLSGLIVSERVKGGYARTSGYVPEPVDRRTTSPGIMMGTAMATSGAAVSPQMGFASRGMLAFTLTLANVRLGRWFPNTTDKQQPQHLRLQSPPFAASAYLRELLGRTNEKSPWVYLSDGGHFENLGIYELVRRRCRFIIVVDAGADPELAFDDLGNAVRKCRLDFGVDIKIDLAPLRPTATDSRPAASHALGVIDYPPTATQQRLRGNILILKSCITQSTAGLPADVLSYHAQHPAFPHQPTTDQWFTESQFESYRQLGYALAMGCLKDAQGVFDLVAHPIPKAPPLKARAAPAAAPAAGGAAATGADAA